MPHTKLSATKDDHPTCVIGGSNENPRSYLADRTYRSEGLSFVGDDPPALFARPDRCRWSHRGSTGGCNYQLGSPYIATLASIGVCLAVYLTTIASTRDAVLIYGAAGGFGTMLAPDPRHTVSGIIRGPAPA